MTKARIKAVEQAKSTVYKIIVVAQAKKNVSKILAVAKVEEEKKRCGK